MTRTIAALLLLICCLGGAAAAADSPVLRIVGDDDYPPYSYAGPDGRPQGIYPDLIAEVLKHMPDKAVKIEVRPWKRAVASVESGRALAVFPPYRWPDERPWMAYSVPLGVEEPVVVCRRDLGGPADRVFPQDYAGVRFVGNLGFLTAGRTYRQMVEAGTIPELQVSGTAEALRRMLTGQADCYVNDLLSIETALAAISAGRNQGADLTIMQRLTPLEAYLGYRAADQAPATIAFREEFDRVLNGLKRDGTVARIVAAHRPAATLAEVPHACRSPSAKAVGCR